MGVRITIEMSPEGELVTQTPIGADKMEGGCPIATQDVDINIKNRQEAIAEHGYGPLNPELDDSGENDKFWKNKAKLWSEGGETVDMGEAMSSRCGNCSAFNVTTKILDCIEKGIGDEPAADAYDVIEAGDLGYCQFLKFKCASNRTCDAWVSGGPLDDAKIKSIG
jgi:hypothetical protein